MLASASAQRFAARPTPITRNPKPASSFRAASPIPEVAPVITAVFPVVFFPVVFSVFSLRAPTCSIFFPSGRFSLVVVMLQLHPFNGHRPAGALDLYSIFRPGSGGIGAARQRPAPGNNLSVLHYSPERIRTAPGIKPYVAGKSPGLNIPGRQGYCYVTAFTGQGHRPRAVSRRDLYLYRCHPFMPGDKIQKR